MVDSRKLFDRYVEVKISTSTQQLAIKDLHMSFEVDLSKFSEPNQARVTIYNLSSDSRDIIAEGLIGLEITAGYTGTKALIFKGTTRGVTHRREGVDWVTYIEAEDSGSEIIYSSFKKSYAKGTPVQLILSEIVATTGLPFEMGFVPVADVITYGWAVNDTVKGALDTICKRHHLQWAVQHGILEVHDAGLPLASAVTSFVFLSSDTGLIGEPEIAIEQNKEEGTVAYISAKSLLNPGLRPGRPVKIMPVFPTTAIGIKKVKDKLDKAFNVKASGLYVVERAVHHGSNFESDFYTEITAKVI